MESKPAGRGFAAIAPRDSAFVIHLVGGPDGPTDQAHGRVEHVTTGRWARFDSVEELLRFMRQTLAAIAAEAR
jgi:hypothetical protein